MSEEIAVYNAGAIAPANNVKLATDVAGLCKAIVTATAQNIQGRKYVRVEGWQAIATAHGCVASARDVEVIEGGIRAIGEVRRMDTGSVICTAEGFLGTDEEMWQKRPLYARRAMCQTRAISRACRSAFAHVVVMMNAGLETTPAEEVPHGGFDDAKPVTPAPAAPAKPTTVTEAQVKRLYAVAKQNNVDTAGIPDALADSFPYVKDATGIHLLHLKASDYDAAVKLFEGDNIPMDTPPAPPPAPPPAVLPPGVKEFWPETEFDQSTEVIVASVAGVIEPVLGKSGKHGPHKVSIKRDDGTQFVVDTFDSTLAAVAKSYVGTVLHEVAFVTTVNGKFTNRKLVGLR
jgi:hypothetical protein